MVLRPDAAIVEQQVEDGLLLLQETGDYVVVNRTGAAIWGLLKTSETLEELVQQLSRLPGAPPEEECGQQVKSFLERLKAAGFLVEAG